MRKTFTLLLTLILFSNSYGNIIFVDESATGSNDGTSWPNSYTSLQDAITNSTYHDTIWVSSGTYFPDEGVGYIDDDRGAYFTLKDSLTILGGFDGTETSYLQRNWTANVCILSGDIDQSGDTLNNSNSVFFINAVNNSARLDGFTITMGVNYNNNAGGGLNLNNTAAVFENLIIEDNYSDVESGGSLAIGAGGVMINGGNGPFFKNSVITNNHSKTNCFWGSTSVSSRSTGGIRIASNNTKLFQVVIENNTSIATNTSTNGGFQGSMSAGGLSVFSPSYINNCVINNNSSESSSEYAFSSGGLYLYLQGASFSAEVSNLIIEGNNAISNGIEKGSGNYAFSAGGLLTEYSNGTNISNTTITNNFGDATSTSGTNFGSAGGIFNGQNYPSCTINNTIVYGNDVESSIIEGSSDYFGFDLVSGFGGNSLNFNNCLFDSYSGGTNCLIGNPDFRAPSNLKGDDNTWFTSDDGLHIGCNSDAINNGDESLLFPDFLDLDEDLDSNEYISMDYRLANRVQLGQLDIGAFEFQGSSTSSGSGTDVISAACGYTWIDGNLYTSDNNTATYTIKGGPDECDSIVTLDLTITPLSDLALNITDPTVCYDNIGTTVTTTTSDFGVDYVLRDNDTDTVVDGPITGDGNALSFNTSSVTSDMMYNVFAVNETKDSAIDLPSTNDYARFSNPYYSFSNEITIEAWINFNNGEHPWASQGTPGVNDMSTNVWLWHAGTLYVNDNGTWRSLAFPTLPSGWVHVSTVADASGLYIYYNGVLVASNALGITTSIVNNSSSAIDLGHDVRFPAGTPTRNSNTGFDNFRVWNLAKSASEISNDMNSCLTGSETGLVQLTKFSEGAGLSISSIKGSDGTMVNPTTNWVEGSGSCGFYCELEMTSTSSVTILPEKIGAENSTICFDETLVVNGTAYNASNASGVEVFTNVGSFGCDSTVTVNLNVLPVIDVSVTYNSNVLSVGSTNADSYQWIDCDNNNAAITGETGQSFTPTSDGNYAVVVTENNCTDTSDCEAISGVGIENAILNQVKVYPNPTEGHVQVNIGSNIGKYAYTLTSVDGKIIMSEKDQTESVLRLNLGDRAVGVYLFTIQTKQGNKTMRIVKN